MSQSVTADQNRACGWDVVDGPCDEEIVGKAINEIDTPVALLDLDLFEANAADISTFLSDHGISWRPHSKAHKSPRLAQIQVGLGAVGITCAKVGEAEAMVRGGIQDIMVANHLGTSSKWRRVADLQKSARVSVCVDDVKHVDMASAAAEVTGVVIPLLIEVDIGMQRVGVEDGASALILADLIAKSEGVVLDGVMGYEGHLLDISPYAEKVRLCGEALAVLVDTANYLRQNGHEVHVVSSGGSGSYQATASIEGLTESQAGGGCLMDLFYAEKCGVKLRHALTLSATVVSTRVPGQIVIDAGAKTLGSVGNYFPPPRVIGRSDLEAHSLSAEHGKFQSSNTKAPLSVGDQLFLIPSYSDSMLVLHNFMIGHRDGIATEVIEMPGRGRLR